MRVTCSSNSGSALPPEDIYAASGFTIDKFFPVTVGDTYPVYALTVFLGTIWYYILDDDKLAWPMWKPSALFEVQDGSLPVGWTFGYHPFPRGDKVILSYPEWANDPYYYERLVDGEERAVEVFERWKLLLETPSRD